MPAAADKGRNLFTPLTSVHVTEFSFAVLSYSAAVFSTPVYISLTRAHTHNKHTQKSPPSRVHGKPQNKNTKKYVTKNVRFL